MLKYLLLAVAALAPLLLLPAVHSTAVAAALLVVEVGFLGCAGFMLWSDHDLQREERRGAKALRLARRMIEAHERGDIGQADQISAEARNIRERKRRPR